MAVGNVPTMAQLNSQVAQLATQYRTTAMSVLWLQAYVTALGQAGLVALGFGSGDATTLIAQVNYMATLAQIYQGTVQQGGTGGTGASLFNFQNALVAVTGPY
jgi:hypothetical protein